MRDVVTKTISVTAMIEGVAVPLTSTETRKISSVNPVNMNGKFNTMELLTKLSEIAKSSKDIMILNSVIHQADNKNEIKIMSMSKFSAEVDCRREVLTRLLKRAVDADLLYKIDSGHYLLNPFVLMGNGLSSRKKELQVEAQVRWRELTDYLTPKDKEKLVKLSTYLGLNYVLTCTDFNLSVANYYDKNGSITDKQKACLV